MVPKSTNRVGAGVRLFLSVIILFCVSACTNTENLKVSDIKCQNQINPVGVGEQQPLFSWIVESEGRNDVAWALATQTTYPSWIDMLDGFNTLSEKWNSKSFTSHNHVMFGSIDSWFYKYLAGIQIDENNPGFQNVIIKPYVPKNLDWVKASVNTVKGRVSSEWHQSAGGFKLKIAVPFGSEAKVYIPAKDVDEIAEGDISVKEAPEILFLKIEDGYAVFKVGSGEYNFSSGL